MKEEAISDALLRQFLLGKVDDELRQRIESLFLTDSPTRDRVFAVEQDLVDEYLEDSLSAGDREAFLLHFAQTPEQQRRLRITKSITDWALTETETDDVSVSETDQIAPSAARTRVRDGWWRRTAFVVPVAAVVILAVLVIVWLNRRFEHRRHLAIEQELAQLNDPSNLRDVPDHPQGALTLSPGALRSSGPRPELQLRSDLPFVEVRLLWLRTERYPMYRALVRRFGSDEAFVIPQLKPEDNGETIRIRLPSRMLSKGLYQIHLSGTAADGTAGVAEEYQFTVR